MTNVVERLRSEVEGWEDSSDAWSIRNDAADEIELFREQLAASQAREQTLQKALNYAVSHLPKHTQEAVSQLVGSTWTDIDDTALGEYRKKVLLEVIAEWEKPYGLTDGTKFIDRLRRMAEEG